ncbi:hypothetical protein ACFWB2_35645 [Streptomyces virginiae]|uniref:hypothetical protein n=1 Tax=Streptomyces virginiae TaxID=1961 RepID=UPI002DD99421|nr:hypothetical protein [Streptomyces virginiae]WSC77922.1 hypothetical protein OHA56_17215 [Streptomyces virginiae]
MSHWTWDYNTDDSAHITGGLREFDILGGRGFINFLAVPRHECVYICGITWYE